MRAVVSVLTVLVAATSGPAMAQSAVAASPLPTCAVADVPTAFTGYDQWQWTLVDTHFRLPADYAPPDIVPASKAGLNGDQQIRAIVVPQLTAMAEAAAAAGHPIAVQSGYRSYRTQVTTFQYWVKVDGYDYALRSSARPGHSEHQLGVALDLRARGGKAPWDYQDWAATATGGWVAANAWRYGFVMSYPKGHEADTCYTYEPWHYRYVGVEAARQIHERGVTPRAFLWEHWRASGAPLPAPSAAKRTTITVQSGDTLWGLARRYGTTVAELRSINGLESDTIRAGMTLEVP